MEATMTTPDQAAGRQCILEQAQRLFFAHGYHGVSIRDIVQSCGLSNAALYYHFGSKQNLYVEVIKEYVAAVAQQVRQAGAGQGSCRERLARMAEAQARFILKSRSEIQTLLRDLTASGDDEIQRLVPDVATRIPSMFAAVMEEGIAAGEIRPVDTHRVSVLLLGMINSQAARRMFDTPAVPLAEDLDLAICALFEGIGA
jgi:TetR/AcrR family transcriptional regulator